MNIEFPTSGGTLEDTQGNDLLIVNDGISDSFLRDAIEDEDVTIRESLEMFEALEDDVNHLSQVQDTLVNYQNIVYLAEGSEHQDAVNATLAVAIEQAVMSLDVPYGAIGPSLEDGSPVVSMEGIGETIRTVWKAIANTIRALWRAMSDFFTAIIGKVVRLRRTAESLLENANNIRGVKPASDVIPMGSELYYLTRNYITPNGADDIVNLMANHISVSDFLLGTYTDATIKSAKDLGDIAREFDITNAEESLAKVNDAQQRAYKELIDKGVTTLKTHKITNEPRYDKGTYQRSETLGGNFGVVFRNAIADLPVGHDSVEMATAIQESGCTIDPLNNKAARTSAKGNIPTFKMSEVTAICTKAKELCDTMEKYNSDTVKRIRKMADQLETDFDAMRKKVEESSNLDANATSRYKATLKYLKAYPMWCNKGQQQLIKLNCNVVYAALVAANRSMKQYK